MTALKWVNFNLKSVKFLFLLSIEADKFVYFNPNRVVEQRHYDIGIELQSSCSVPPEETIGIMLPDD